MNRKELEERLQKELNLPFYRAKIADRNYTEAEYQDMKAQLNKDYLDYVDTYIDYAENDV
ncbi:hypothetical protein [Lactococcus formosensis]|jgi:hypothetical protein|uniref:Uncharacterized protein n=1 Tax=Lactococcus formosensis TaxID=1281486 RepID=A0A9Q8Y1L9_9LACT|nr:hypothetical protein [Lactococcus formosensis]MCH1724045.1 hypothetical protein [Lactococcus formosensis]MCO7181139.1 hypothetical protein [Lactococcus formosensis]MDG6112278.1 hypothetical protein [Lactococcus formosensis]MDG6114580.1 hypothetical protein [Lactococcus formosensis]MDG6116711.1 hypothetical protein [Lactococcus formosensis]